MQKVSENLTPYLTNVNSPYTSGRISTNEIKAYSPTQSTHPDLKAKPKKRKRMGSPKYPKPEFILDGEEMETADLQFTKKQIRNLSHESTQQNL